MKYALCAFFAALFLPCSAFASDLALATSALNEGQASQKLGQHAKAIEHCKEGIALLGQSYSYRGLIDDTGQKLVLAQTKEREKNLNSSAYIFCRVLEDRIAAFTQKSKLPAEPNAKEL